MKTHQDTNRFIQKINLQIALPQLSCTNNFHSSFFLKKFRIRFFPKLTNCFATIKLYKQFSSFILSKKF